MDDPEESLIDAQVFVRDHYTRYAALGKDVAVSYRTADGRIMVFELDDKSIGLSEKETLVGLPVGEMSFDVEVDELHGLIAALSNMNADSPIFEDYFLGIKNLSVISDFYQGMLVPAQVASAVGKLAPEWDFNEQAIMIMLALADRRGNRNAVFRRYVVISDEPITTDDIEEAVLEKIRVSGKLIDLETISPRKK